MKIIPSRELRLNPGKVWKQMNREEPLVITSNGKPVALLCSTDSESLEATLEQWRQVNFLKTLRSAQKAASESGTSDLSMKDIDQEISIVRKKRRK
jgi:prevent-host-death family protein